MTGVATLAMELLERRPPAPSPCHDPVRNGKVKLTIVDFRKLTIVDFSQLTEKQSQKRRVQISNQITPRNFEGGTNRR